MVCEYSTPEICLESKLLLRYSEWEMLLRKVDPPNLKRATESATSKPRLKALTKSSPFCKAPLSVVCFDVRNSTARFLTCRRTGS
jgi:hypothetical protein